MESKREIVWRKEGERERERVRKKEGESLDGKERKGEDGRVSWQRGD